MTVQRVAVLIDGDNMSARHSPKVIASASALGQVDVTRVYIAANRQTDWHSTPGYRLMHAGTSKNAADVLLSIDAMELALTGGMDAFVIATSDRDFAHLAHRLRELGKHVLGVGEGKAPNEFRLACSAFCLLADAERAPPAAALTPAAATARGISEFDQQIRAMIAKHSQNGRGMQVALLAPKMHQAHGTKISTRPERSWRAYLAARPALYDLDPRGPEAMVRFRPEGFAAPRPA